MKRRREEAPAAEGSSAEEGGEGGGERRGEVQATRRAYALAPPHRAAASTCHTRKAVQREAVRRCPLPNTSTTPRPTLPNTKVPRHRDGEALPGIELVWYTMTANPREQRVEGGRRGACEARRRDEDAGRHACLPIEGRCARN